jgi:hypothetical protein
MAFSHNNNTGSHYGQKCYRRYCYYYLLKMSINGESTIFVIASLKIQRVSLHPWLIIELSPAFLSKPWLWQHCNCVLNRSVNRASTTFGLASWKLKGLCGDIELSSNHRPPFFPKMVVTTSRLCPNNERQWRVNGSVSSGSGKPASGPVFGLRFSSVRFQTRPKTRPAVSWRACYPDRI